MLLKAFRVTAVRRIPTEMKSIIENVSSQVFTSFCSSIYSLLPHHDVRHERKECQYKGASKNRRQLEEPHLGAGRLNRRHENGHTEHLPGIHGRRDGNTHATLGMHQPD